MTAVDNDELAKSSSDAVWRLKEICYPPGSSNVYKTVSQNRNGPCSLIALCNIMILRGDIKIQPSGRTSASYEYLASLVADYLVNSREGLSDVDLSSALAVLPSTQRGMDLNPVFTGISSFHPAADGGELKLFELCEVALVHGWLADPSAPEYPVLARAEDYDTALNMVVAGEEVLSNVKPGEDSGVSSDAKYQDALAIRQFLEANSTQLTYHGLFSLSALKPGLYALIRNSHLSVLLVHVLASGDPSLWTLVTDSNFVNEPAVVWESLEDVDGAGSCFVDGSLIISSTAGGDFAGRSAESALRDTEPNVDASQTFEADLALAQQLQAEEDELVREAERLGISEAGDQPNPAPQGSGVSPPSQLPLPEPEPAPSHISNNSRHPQSLSSESSKKCTVM